MMQMFMSLLVKCQIIMQIYDFKSRLVKCHNIMQIYFLVGLVCHVIVMQIYSKCLFVQCHL